MMKIFYEKAIVETGDKGLIKVLELWHSLCIEKIGADFEVMVANRKEHKQLSAFNGELYTAMPHILEGGLKLVVYVNDTKDVPFIFLSHEICHWIAKLKGFKGLINRANPHSNIEIILNSLLHHPEVYEIQKACGHDPREAIRDRFQQSMKLFTRDGEGQSKEIRVQNALIILDDFLHSSQAERKLMLEILSKKHKLTKKIFSNFFKLSSDYNLLDPFDIERLSREILKKSGINEKVWETIDEIPKLRDMANKVSKVN